jgi:hypothetical protein
MTNAREWKIFSAMVGVFGVASTCRWQIRRLSSAILGRSSSCNGMHEITRSPASSRLCSSRGPSSRSCPKPP